MTVHTRKKMLIFWWAGKLGVKKSLEISKGTRLQESPLSAVYGQLQLPAQQQQGEQQEAAKKTSKRSLHAHALQLLQM